MSTVKQLQTDVAIVGGGIVGSSAALALRRMGLRVVLLERDLCGSRSSGVNYGGVRRQGRPLEPAAAGAARAPHLGPAARTARHRRRIHPLGPFQDRAQRRRTWPRSKRYRALSSDFDLGLELISGARLREQCPWLGARAVGGSLCAEDGQANPRLVSPAFALAAQRAGAQIFERHKVDEVAHDGASCSWCAAATRSRCRRPCCSTARAPGPAPSPSQFGETLPLRSRSP